MAKVSAIVPTVSDPAEVPLLKSNLKQLRLPTISSEYQKLAREAASTNQTYEQYLLRLTELEVSTRQSNALLTRMKQADFPVEKDLDSFDFSAIPSLNKPKVRSWRVASGSRSTRMCACWDSRAREKRTWRFRWQQRRAASDIECDFSRRRVW